MALTGTIVSVVSTQARTGQNGYQSQNGFIYTFDMIIQCSDGQHSGEIGSKNEMYPIAVGQQISVTADTGQHGVKFKKFNPQYKPQQDIPQGSPQPAQATKSPQAASADTPRDYDKENRGKCRHGLYCAVIQAGLDPVVLNAMPDTLKAIECLVEKAMNGIGSLPVQQREIPTVQEGDGVPF